MGTELDEPERRELRRKARAALLSALHEHGGEGRRRAILETALGCGGFTPRELAAPAPPSAAGKYQRLVDHQLSWALTDLRRGGLVENPRWSTWRLAGAAEQPPEPATHERPAPARLAELRALPYRLYLRTPEWRRTRNAALARAGHRCSLDVSHVGGLDVHHRTYERIGAELAADLVVLCRDCHERHHLRELADARRAPGRAGTSSGARAARTARRLLRLLLGR